MVPISSVSEPNLTSSAILDLILDEDKKAFWRNPLKMFYDRHGLPYNVESGGSIIDFDCSHNATDGQSVLTRSGTIPYMSVDLLYPPPRGGAIAHQLSHDIESLCMILIHIMYFTSGPVGAEVSKPSTSREQHVSQWHHEDNFSVLRDLKSVDLKYLAQYPKDFVNEYWVPAAPFLSKLLRIVYPGIKEVDMDSRNLLFQRFRSILIDALQHISTIHEVPHKYAALTQYKPAGAPQKCPQIETLDAKLDTLLMAYNMLLTCIPANTLGSVDNHVALCCDDYPNVRFWTRQEWNSAMHDDVLQVDPPDKSELFLELEEEGDESKEPSPPGPAGHEASAKRSKVVFEHADELHALNLHHAPPAGPEGQIQASTSNTEWVKNNPQGMTDDFKVYYNNLPAEQKQVWEDKSKASL
ncbi:hypothetical protein HYPSUDRAFT_208743 [Hypholoma sublateritium FD-334 SS-4]|uniref:Fungal-type protein kinase domain-containing protein n=1 Tax=Hypholoma sublateritium (strain FD-334 SS-4) TaxID=945553 RepID=A0A0D2LU48_HYPSF|nr:hypothetical protein HYPSUDRAFT_208743 [Hypholoma sublateritium FD-334 SS-4]